MRRSLAFAVCLGLGLAAAVPRRVVCAAETGSRSSGTIQQFLKIRTPGAPVILPDGSLLQRDWPDGIYQLYRVTPKATGTDVSYQSANVTRTKLTDYPDGLSGFSVSPDGKRVVVMHARGGNENTQLTQLDLASGSTSPILANPSVQASVNEWLVDGSGLIYSANDASPNDFHLYRWDFATGKATKLLGEAGAWGAADVAGDGSRVLVHQFISASDVKCHELDVATGKLRDLTIRPPDGTAASNFVGYMPGERAVLMTSDYKDGMSRLYLKDLKSGAIKEPIPSLSRFELDGAATNNTREFLVVVANEDGYGVTYVYSLPDFKPLPLPPTEKGVTFPSNFRGSTLVWTRSNARSAGNAFATTFSKPGKNAAPPVTRQLTWTEDQGIDLAGFPLPELVKYRAFDGTEIPGFIYFPPGHQKGTPIPFVVYYHGGPEGQSRPGFSAALQYLLSRGFGLMLPNVRGSTGYGRAFQMMDDYKKRWDSVRDGVDAAEWLVQSGHAQPGRIATYGGSYGGFMSVACIVEDQERVDRGARKERMFGACVDIVGVVNLKTFLEKTSGYRRKLREVEYGPLTDPEFLLSVSSIQRVDKMKVPFFIAHGFNDPRVPVEEAMLLATALKDRGQNPRVFIAPDEGHGFAKLDNRIYFNERAAAFLEETIVGGAATAMKP
ncbi:MAG: prolyl oligopeptidase family serine peptidase [Candidatus Eiseniibacteriota bacterium]